MASLTLNLWFTGLLVLFNVEFLIDDWFDCIDCIALTIVLLVLCD